MRTSSRSTVGSRQSKLPSSSGMLGEAFRCRSPRIADAPDAEIGPSGAIPRSACAATDGAARVRQSARILAMSDATKVRYIKLLQACGIAQAAGELLDLDSLADDLDVVPPVIEIDLDQLH